jgi:hypothetical protein
MVTRPPSIHSSVCLTFDKGTPDLIRRRIMYAFRVFAAVYDHAVVEEDIREAVLPCRYGRQSSPDEARRTLSIPAHYPLRPRNDPPVRPQKHTYAGEDFYLFYGIDAQTGNPDWLAEIFEWLSCDTEIGVAARDLIGRIPFSQSIFAQNEISPRKPYAMLLMAWLENALQRTGLECLLKAPSPVVDADHLVVSSHDIDYYYDGLVNAMVRLAKNMALSLLPGGNWSFFSWNARRVFSIFRGARIGDFLPALGAASREFDFQSTIFVVPRRSHRRDPNYHIDTLIPHLGANASPGFSVGLHGSYRSIIEESELSAEVQLVERSLGVRPRGSRQHWLRFDEHKKLFDAVQVAGLHYDSTLGFDETPGFRNGACFAFPPYNFAKEEPYPFLEIPLVLMDSNLEAAARADGKGAEVIVEEVLDASREWGWGGIAVNWHNPIEPVQVPESINSIFWDCLKRKDAYRERWISADEFLACCSSRFRNAGLLPSVHVDA